MSTTHKKSAAKRAVKTTRAVRRQPAQSRGEGRSVKRAAAAVTRSVVARTPRRVKRLVTGGRVGIVLGAAALGILAVKLRHAFA